jgi:hypothetical protein
MFCVGDTGGTVFVVVVVVVVVVEVDGDSFLPLQAVKRPAVMIATTPAAANTRLAVKPGVIQIVLRFIGFQWLAPSPYGRRDGNAAATLSGTLLSCSRSGVFGHEYVTGAFASARKKIARTRLQHSGNGLAMPSGGRHGWSHVFTRGVRSRR